MLSKRDAIRYIRKIQTKLGQNVVLDELEKKTQYEQFVTDSRRTLLSQVDIPSQIIEDAQSLVIKREDANPFIVQIITKAFVPFKQAFQSANKKSSLDFYIWAAEASASMSLDQLFGSPDFTLTNEVVLSELETLQNLMIESVDQTTKEDIAKLIQQGTRGELTGQEIQQLIRESYTDISKNRAEAIARTELTNVASYMDTQVYQKSGITQYEWQTVLDDRVSQRCNGLHGQIVGAGANFVSTADGWTGTRPPAHVNCRCRLEPVFNDLESEFLRAWRGE